MNDILDEFKDSWSDARDKISTEKASVSELIQQATTSLKSSSRQLYKNAWVLLFTLVGISAFFTYVAPFQEILSHVGMGLMLGVLVVRIVIEFFSIHHAKHLDLSAETTASNAALIWYHSFRKKMQQPFTLILLLIFALGFYLLTPEFGIYFNRTLLLLIDGSFIIGIAISVRFILQAVKKENDYLQHLVAINKRLRE